MIRGDKYNKTGGDIQIVKDLMIDGRIQDVLIKKEKDMSGVMRMFPAFALSKTYIFDKLDLSNVSGIIKYFENWMGEERYFYIPKDVFFMHSRLDNYGSQEGEEKLYIRLKHFKSLEKSDGEGFETCEDFFDQHFVLHLFAGEIVIEDDGEKEKYFEQLYAGQYDRVFSDYRYKNQKDISMEMISQKCA